LKQKLFSIFITLIVVVAFSSCSLERKLAKQFVENRDTIAVLLIPPDFLFKANLKTWSAGDIDQLDPQEQDALLYDSSKFIKHIVDSVFIGRYMNALQAELARYGIQTYTQDELLEFMSLENTAYQVSLAQLEVEEGIYEYRAQEVFDTTMYYEDFLLDQLSLNSWFEISKLNDQIGVNNVLYASDFVTEGLEGRFTSNIFTGEVRFKYNIFPLEMEDIYTLAAISGERYAGYVFDYIMNRYIFLNFPSGQQPSTYLRYDLDSKVFYPAYEDRFIFLEE
jgi:hypothetical protein